MAVTRLYKKQSIVVNIPSFTLTYFKESKPVLVSRVVVGNPWIKQPSLAVKWTKLYLVPIGMCIKYFKKRNITSYRKNSNYLAKHDMEWVGRRVRQRPGRKMHWVKWNSFSQLSYYFYAWYAIKSLFDREQRAFSHGCIRLAVLET
jgi:murein L,D-transpeptidase YcbB/YkuD